MEQRRLTLTVTAEQAGTKVDTLLRSGLGLSGTVIRRIKWLPDGILLDGLRVQTDARPAGGQILSVLVGDPSRLSGIVPAAGPLDIVYEDGDMLVLNKAPGITVHPGPGHYDDTLGNFLLDYYDKTGVMADFHPVHRLDKGTSGLMVVAKHAHAQELLKRQLHTPDFRRIYLAVCEGVPEPPFGVIDAPIGPVEGSLIARQVRPDGLPARTQYRVLETKNSRSLLRLELESGRTHQIRVHMAYLGHPLVGDFLYGTENQALITRPALHSAELHCRQPITGELLEFQVELPEDIRGSFGN
ncbi:MAG: RluA family pseudouridine synthase [Pseudoflavonifractor sp.]